jgi:hypothetical protein
MANTSDRAFRESEKVLADYEELVNQLLSGTGKGSARVAKPTPSVPKATIKKLTREVIKAFTGRGFGFDIEIPGTHYSGLTNQAMLEVRENEGRMFASDGAAIQVWLRKELNERFDGTGSVPSLAAITDLAEKLVRQRIIDRVKLGGIDVAVPALTAKYAAWKRKKGKGYKPVGEFSGRWLRAVAKARIKFGTSRR